MAMPNLLIIGAAKAGTTSLYHYLAQHPDIFMTPRKETNFFALEGQTPQFQGPGDEDINAPSITTLAAYRRQFDGATDEKIRGEASPLYLYHEDAPRRIAHYVPHAKLVAVLRDPVARAYSHFMFMTRLQREPLPRFEAALEDEDRRVARRWEWSWHYKRVGFYHAQLSRYVERFPAHQLRIYLYEDFRNHPHRLLRDLFTFLDVDPSFEPDMTYRYGFSGAPRSTLLNRLLRASPLRRLARTLLPPAPRRRIGRAIARFNTVKPPLSDETRQALRETYRTDLLKLQALLGRDLSDWLP